MTSGRDVSGVVLREDDRTVTVALDYGTITFPRSHVAKVVKDAKPAAPKAPAPARAAPKQAAPRIPTWLAAVKTLTAQPWAHDFRQIPATVIDAGVMKDVPYQSFRCGSDYEVNVYGDPDAPAAVEIGVYRELLKDRQAKENCVGFIAAVLGDPIDAGILRLLDRRQDLVLRKGLSIEITPETAEDAYGGWWVSVYDEEALDKARASEKEIEQITDTRPQSVADATPTARGVDQRPQAASARSAGSKAPPAPQRLPRGLSFDGWNGDYGWDWSEPVGPRGMRASGGGGSSGGGGRVYVRGYHRRDGTYVRAHSRSAPRRR